MAFMSGRKADQTGRVSVLEGDTLYVSPKRFSSMQDAIVGLPQNNQQSFSTSADENARRALLAAGLSETDIMLRQGRETRIVVDYELSD